METEVTDWLRQRAEATPEKLALIIGESQWTYAELDAHTNFLSGWLVQSGVQAGQLASVLMPNSFDMVCLIHALARLGVTLVPLNGRLTIPELTWQLNNTQARWLIHDNTEIQRATKLAQPANCKGLNIATAKGDNGNWRLVLSEVEGLAISNWQLETIQAIVFTSGTTGNPKGVMLTFANHFWSANASAYRLGVAPDDRWVSCLPLYHVGGLAVIFRSCLYGTAVILHPRFDINAINYSLDTQHGSLISVVPTMLFRLLESRTFWPTSLRLILVGGAAASPKLVERANELPRKAVNSNQFSVNSSQLPIVATTYGLTEAASQVATQTPADTAKKPGSVGKPLMFSSVRIVDENGRSLPTNEIGEVVVSGPTVMAGYLNHEITSAKTLQDDELYSGDVGYLDEDGDLWLVQRRSDIIVSGGENVYPAEVEKVYKAHPAVTAVCVVGIPDEEWGEVVTALISLHKDGIVTEDELIQYGRQHLAGYKQPRHIRFTDALPLTASGKVHRKAVKEQMERS